MRTLGEKLLALAADPELGTRGFTFTLDSHHERRELVAICRYLLSLGVLLRADRRPGRRRTPPSSSKSASSP